MRENFDTDIGKPNRILNWPVLLDHNVLITSRSLKTTGMQNDDRKSKLTIVPLLRIEFSFYQIGLVAKCLT